MTHATTLAAEPASAGRARRFVASAVEELGYGALVDVAELGVSELVTNALLHGRSCVEVKVDPRGERVRICVRDDNPLPAVPKDYDELAPTGRGLTLVADLAAAVGVELHGESGKSMWFELSATEADGGSADPDAWYEVPRPEPVGCRAVLVALPLQLWAAAQQHTDGMLREMLLHRFDPGQAESLTTFDDLAMAEAAHGLLVAAIDEARETATIDRTDVPVMVTEKDLRGFAVLQDVLDRGDRLAAAGELLAFPALPEIVSLRDWCCQQVMAQTNGVAATAWELIDPIGEGWTARFEVSRPVFDDTDVRRSTECVVVADDHNRVIAVSAPACELLGWDADDLVGRRVVAIVPAYLRETLVAMFTRHQATGEEQLVGREVVVPLRHHDGHELDCRVLVTRATSDDGRSLYLTRMQPLAP